MIKKILNWLFGTNCDFCNKSKWDIYFNVNSKDEIDQRFICGECCNNHK